MKKLPQEFCDRMQLILGERFNDYINSLEQSPIKAFRVNTDKISLNYFEKINGFGNEKIPYVENGYYLDYERVGNHPFHHAGMIYVQEPAAMAPAECIEINPDWKILDMCAAPGGKSTQLKLKLGENGLLVSNEIIPSCCKILTGNIERLGLHNVVTTCMDTSRLAKAFPNAFDMIMVDAPCSGEGMFRKEQIAIDEWSSDNVNKCAVRQSEILENAVKMLKDGGYIVYATCTFSLEENEITVDKFLQNHPEFEIVPVKKAVEQASQDGILYNGCISKSLNLARRFYPHTSKGEGQFMAVLKNTNQSINTKAISYRETKIDKMVFEFLDDTLVGYKKQNVKMYNQNPIYFNGVLDIKDGDAFSCGITIGEIKKNYIMPHHQFFMALGISFKRKIELSCESEDLSKYLHGEEINTDCKNGWAVVTINGCTVGGGKVVNGKLKNHYPKGLRKQI